MKIELNLNKLRKNFLSPNQFILLYLLYEKEFDTLLHLFGKEGSFKIRNSLRDSEFLLDCPDRFTETLISKSHVEKLLGIKNSEINFADWYQIYPIKVGNRVLRSSGCTTESYKKHKQKYLKRVTTIEEHQLAIKATEAFVSHQKRSDNLRFLPNIETVLNNSKWQEWEVFIEQSGRESLKWNNEVI